MMHTSRSHLTVGVVSSTDRHTDTLLRHLSTFDGVAFGAVVCFCALPWIQVPGVSEHIETPDTRLTVWEASKKLLLWDISKIWATLLLFIFSCTAGLFQLFAYTHSFVEICSLFLINISFQAVKGKVKAGKVDCQAYGHTCQTADIRAYPTVKFYPYQGTKVKCYWWADTVSKCISFHIKTKQNTSGIY